MEKKQSSYFYILKRGKHSQVLPKGGVQKLCQLHQKSTNPLSSVQGPLYIELVQLNCLSFTPNEAHLSDHFSCCKMGLNFDLFAGLTNRNNAALMSLLFDEGLVVPQHYQTTKSGWRCSVFLDYLFQSSDITKYRSSVFVWIKQKTKLNVLISGLEMLVGRFCYLLTEPAQLFSPVYNPSQSVAGCSRIIIKGWI